MVLLIPLPVVTGVRDSAPKGPENPVVAETLLESVFRSDEDESVSLELERGTVVDRYTVLEPIGRGAMGAVYTAYDPRLDRRIALKLMLAKPGRADDVRVRLLREAQALARLNHPNVVTVHDADAVGDLVFLAMELVEGTNLTKWLKLRPRTREEILEVFLAAGRGLAAAHDADLVHRDFKPDNVLVGDDGRVRVVDFGIAREAGGLVQEQAEQTRVPGSTSGPTSEVVNVQTIDPDDAFIDTDEADIVDRIKHQVETKNRDKAASRKLDALGRRPGSGRKNKPPNELVSQLAQSSPGQKDVYQQGTADTEPGPVKVPEPPPPPDDEYFEGPYNTRKEDSLERSGTSLAAAKLTQTGALVGTPAYMAPEQHMGLNINAKSDQFGFCVALYEALYGSHPYAFTNIVDLTLAVLTGKIQPAPPGSTVPPRLRAALVKGMSVSPDDRHPSMSHLLEVLGDDPTKRRKRWIWTAAAGFAAATVLVAGGRELGATNSQCADTDRHLVDIWTADTRTELRERFAATNQPYAEQAWKNSADTLDVYASNWVAMRTEACEATHIHGEQSDSLLDRRMACLDGKLRSLAATTELLREANPAVILRAVELVDSLPQLDECADTNKLYQRKAPPTGARKQVLDRLERTAARVVGLITAGSFAEAVQLARSLAADAKNADFPEVYANARFFLARAQIELAKYDDAESNLSHTLALAERGGFDELRASVLRELALVIGNYKKRYADGEIHVRHAQAVGDRVGIDAVEQAETRKILGVILYHDRLDEAIVELEAAVEMLEEVGDRGALARASTLNTLGVFRDLAGDQTRALEHYQLARTLLEKRLGPDHPDVAKVLNNIAVIVKTQGDYQRAREYCERTLDIRRRSLGADHPDIATSLMNLGNVYVLLGDIEQALAHHEAALAQYRRTFGEGSEEEAVSLFNIGVSLQTSGKYERAISYYQRAVPLFKPGDIEVASPLTGIGGSLVELHRYDEALEHLERALELRTSADEESLELPEIRFALARALIGATKSPNRSLLERARNLAEAAQTGYREQNEENTVRQITKWLEEQDLK